MNFKDTFNYTAGALGAVGPYDAANVNTGAQICIPGAAISLSAAVLTKTVVDADVHARANVAFFREKFSSSISSFTTGTSTVLTLATPHGATTAGAWTLVSVSGVSGSVGLNGIFYGSLEGTNDVRVFVDTTADTPTGGTVTDQGMTFSLACRLNTDVVASTFLPTQGYLAQLSWEVSGVRKITILRYDMGAQLGITAAGSATILGSYTLLTEEVNRDSSSADFKISQDFRMIVDDDNRKAGRVRVRAYLNNLDDESPQLELFDTGAETASPPVATSPLSIAREGAFGFQFFSQEMGMNLFQVADYYAQTSNATPAKDNTRTLGTLRDNVKTRVERSTGSTFPDSLYEDWLREAQDEIVNELGMMAMFLRNRKVYTLDPEDEDLQNGTKRYILPKEIRWIESLKSSATQQELSWEFAYQDESGRMVIDVFADDRGSGPYDMIYFTHPRRFELTTDESSIPREFRNVLIQLAIVKAAQYHSDGNLEISARGEYARVYKVMSMSMQRIHQQTHRSKFTGPRGNVSNRYVPAWQAWGSF